MSSIQSAIRSISTLLSGRDVGVLAEISRATGVSLFALAGMTRPQIVDAIRDAGIPLSTVPDHIVHALGLVRAH